MVLAIVDDMIFRGKIEAAAKELGTALTVARDAEAALRLGQGWSRVLIDLNLSKGDPVAMVRNLRQAYPDVPVIGYCSHVQQDLQRQALEAGCTMVLPRSAFIQQLPNLLSAGEIGIFTNKEWKQIKRLAAQPPAAVCENAEDSLRYLKRHLDRLK